MTLFGGIDLRQMVLIATAWRDWPLTEDSWRSVDRLVRALLGPTTDGAMDAWLAVTDDGAVRAGDWASGADAQLGARKFVDRLAAAAGMTDAAARQREITRARLRVLCGPERTAAVFPSADGAGVGARVGTGAGTGAETGGAGCAGGKGHRRPRHWTALDVRFVSDKPTTFQIHMGFSFWTMRPPWHPEEVKDATKPIDLDGIPALRATFERRATTAAMNLVDKHFGPTTTLVWRREHAPPMFWAATVAKPRKDLSRYLDDTDVAERLIRPLLDRGPRDSGVAASIINGNVLTLRHFRQESPEPIDDGAAGDDTARDGPADGKDHIAIRPVYFLLLGPPPADGPDDANAAPQDYRHQQVITSLTEFEARAATDMHDIDDDLEVWSTHVRVYDSVAEQAGTLWDALALHLPVRKGDDLAATHRAIALVHQTLLQGVADLADVESQVMALTTKVDELADQLADLVDERLAERPLSTPYRGVGQSVAQASQLSRLRRLSGVVLADARRVKRQYEDLLASIAHAFDERRVRELDVLQRGGHSLSIAVAVVTIVAVLDFLFNVKNAGSLPWLWRFVFGGLAAAFGLGLLLVVFGNLWSVRKAQEITSSNFRTHYDKLLSYLRDSSTRELSRHPAASARSDDDDEARRAWAELDHTLATRFAELWDTATAGTPPPGSRQRPPGDDITMLAADVEQWTLRALLLTERPRRLSRYRLPKLTLLYRHCVALNRARQWETTDALVADVDLELTLHEEGYSIVEARAIDRYIGTLTRARQGAGQGAETDPPGTARLLQDIEQVLDSRTPVSALDHDNRNFVRYAVGWLTERGVQQFIDIGAGLPESDGVHVLAENAKVLYVDSALDVVAQGQALLAEPGRAEIIEADMRIEQDRILARADTLFDLEQPVAVLFTRVLGYVPDEDARTTMALFRDRLPAGAYVVISHAAPGSLGVGGLEHIPTNNDGIGIERLRTQEQIQGFFQHLQLDHGLVDAADPSGETSPRADKIHIAAGIARVS